MITSKTLLTVCLLTIPGPGCSKLVKPRVSAKFKFRCDNLKSKFSLIHFLNELMIGCSLKNNRENYPKKCF